MGMLPIHVTPKSGRDEVVGWRGSELAVRVTAAPEGGKATAAACKLVATALHVPKTSVRVVRGDTSRHKALEIDGVGEAEIRSSFGEPDSSLF